MCRQLYSDPNKNYLCHRGYRIECFQFFKPDADITELTRTIVAYQPKSIPFIFEKYGHRLKSKTPEYLKIECSSSVSNYKRNCEFFQISPQKLIHRLNEHVFEVFLKARGCDRDTSELIDYCIDHNDAYEPEKELDHAVEIGDSDIAERLIRSGCRFTRKIRKKCSNKMLLDLAKYY